MSTSESFEALATPGKMRNAATGSSSAGHADGELSVRHARVISSARL
jgi:hypothetical protein